MIDKIRKLLGFPSIDNVMLQAAIGGALDIMREKMEDGELNSIVSLHYASQLYDFFARNPFVLTVIIDIEAGNVVTKTNDLWGEELGWSHEEIVRANLLGLVYEGDRHRTLNAHKDVETFKGLGTFENRYICKHKTRNSFNINGVECVWLSWSVDHDYENEDKYRMSFAKVIEKGSPIFEGLQEKYKLL
jgi:PAS domain-containing protein